MDSRVGLAILAVALTLTPAALPPPHPGSGGYTAVPVATSDALISGLSAPTVAPGGSGSISFALTNPLSAAMSAVVLTLGVYAFVPFPGNATAPVIPSESPVFASAGSNASSDAFSIPQLGAGARFTVPGNASSTVLVPPGTPTGTFAIRLSLSFAVGSQAYLFESRGYFSTDQWENATTLPNGASTLNVSRLGVSGIVPETALLVRANSTGPILDVILGGSVLLAVVGGFVAYRRGPGSRSGRWAPREPHSAPSAFGNKRTNDGD